MKELTIDPLAQGATSIGTLESNNQGTARITDYSKPPAMSAMIEVPHAMINPNTLDTIIAGSEILQSDLDPQIKVIRNQE